LHRFEHRLVVGSHAVGRKTVRAQAAHFSVSFATRRWPSSSHTSGTRMPVTPSSMISERARARPKAGVPVGHHLDDVGRGAPPTGSG
jgi:hypothetical protein